MTLEEFTRLLKRQWRLTAATVLVGAFAAIVLGLVAGRTYRATANLVLTPSANAAAEAGARSSVLISSSGMATYAHLATSVDVAAAVVAELGLSESPSDLSRRLVASVPANSYLIDLSATADTADEAARIANTAARHAAAKVGALFTEGPSGFVLAVATKADPATVVAPGVLRLVPLGVLIGLMVGLGLAIIREILDHRIRDDDDLRRSLGIEPLARVDLSGAGDRDRSMFDTRGWDEATLESVRRLRTTLRMRRDAPRTILVAGVSGGEGASPVAALLAQISAASGAKTLLVECDLRAPTVNARLGLTGGLGLSDFLTGRAALGDILFDASAKVSSPTRRPRWPGEPPDSCVLGVVAAGSTSRQPGELLGGTRLREFLEAVAPFYDTVIFDGAAVLRYADSVAVSTVVEATVLVAAVGRTPRRDIDRAITQLDAVGADVAGVVLASTGLRGRGSAPAGRRAAAGAEGHS